MLFSFLCYGLQLTKYSTNTRGLVNHQVRRESYETTPTEPACKKDSDFSFKIVSSKKDLKG